MILAFPTIGYFYTNSQSHYFYVFNYFKFTDGSFSSSMYSVLENDTYKLEKNVHFIFIV